MEWSGVLWTHECLAVASLGLTWLWLALPTSRCFCLQRLLSRAGFPEHCTGPLPHAWNWGKIRFRAVLSCPSTLACWYAGMLAQDRPPHDRRPHDSGPTQPYLQIALNPHLIVHVRCGLIVFMLCICVCLCHFAVFVHSVVAGKTLICRHCCPCATSSCACCCCAVVASVSLSHSFCLSLSHSPSYC